jgi:hypothetical protein
MMEVLIFYFAPYAVFFAFSVMISSASRAFAILLSVVRQGMPLYPCLSSLPGASTRSLPEDFPLAVASYSTACCMDDYMANVLQLQEKMTESFGNDEQVNYG